MSEVRYKEALGNLDPDMRTCIIHHDNQIKEIKASPLKAFKELETKVLKDLSRMEQRDKIWVKGLANILNLEDELRKQTPTLLEQRQKESLLELDEKGKHYQKLFEKEYKRTENERNLAIEVYEDIQKLFKLYKKYEKKSTNRQMRLKAELKEETEVDREKKGNVNGS